MSRPRCICIPGGVTKGCPTHVDCDQSCKALRDPLTPIEMDAALVHWQEHSWLTGCAHGLSAP